MGELKNKMKMQLVEPNLAQKLRDAVDKIFEDHRSDLYNRVNFNFMFQHMAQKEWELGYFQSLDHRKTHGCAYLDELNLTPFPVVCVRDKEGACDTYVRAREENGDYKKYKDRGQRSFLAIRRQDRDSMMSQWIAYRTFSPFVQDMPEPDMTVKKKEDKDFEIDLPSASLNLGVKSCHTLSPCRTSWIFGWSQIGGGGKDKNAFENVPPYYWLCLVMYDRTPRQGRIVALVPPQVITSRFLYREPDKHNLQGSKKAVWWTDLVKNKLCPNQSQDVRNLLESINFNEDKIIYDPTGMPFSEKWVR